VRVPALLYSRSIFCHCHSHQLQSPRDRVTGAFKLLAREAPHRSQCLSKC
jgi:hypothetical protein